jgi:hypothetical protein
MRGTSAGALRGIALARDFIHIRTSTDLPIPAPHSECRGQYLFMPYGRHRSTAMPRAWSNKDERQYEHIKESAGKRGRSSRRAKQIAAATVNKQRSEEGRTKSSRSGSSASNGRRRSNRGRTTTGRAGSSRSRSSPRGRASGGSRRSGGRSRSRASSR